MQGVNQVEDSQKLNYKIKLIAMTQAMQINEDRIHKHFPISVVSEM